MPNATVAEYGTYSILGDPHGIVHKLQSEIYARGPIATGVNAEPLVEYTGGRVDDTKVRPYPTIFGTILPLRDT